MNWLLTTCAEPVLSPFFTDEKRPPLGIGFLMGVLRRAGHRVYFIDNYLKPSDFLETDYLTRHQIDAVGIYMNTVCLHDGLRMINKLVRLRQKGAWRGKIVVGGPHPSVLPESIPEEVDHVVIGEGESAILDIVEGRAERIVQKPLIHDLDSLPPPAWDDFLDLPYDWTSDLLSAKPVVSMNTSRGCPYQCAFCSVQSVWGRTYRFFSPDWIIENIRYLISRGGCKAIYFREDNFTASRKRVIEFCAKLKQAGLDLQWLCESRVDTLDRELIKLMHDGGCRALYLGVESGSQRLLDFVDKGITTGQIEAVFAWCRETGIKTYASFIVGLPTETAADREQSESLRRKIKPDSFSNNVFVGMPTSRLYQYVLDNKLSCYVDDRAMAYLDGHDQMVETYYGGNEARKVPFPHCGHYVTSRRLLEEGKRFQALAKAVQAVSRHPSSSRYWRQMVKTLLPKAMLDMIEKKKNGRDS
ncbi:MAG TPA: radical SAM protein [bacterium]|nr:radical SAM protein [bacterium]